MTSLLLRWLPAVVVPAVIAAGSLAGAVQSGAAADLPPKTAAQVLAMIGHGDVRALSGTLEQTSELGLPQLPSSGPAAGSGPASVMELLTGTHTARVYLDGPENVRLQVMDSLAERDVVRRGREVWLYNSKDNSATHLQLPAGTGLRGHALPAPAQTPGQLAERLLAALDPSTDVTVGRDAKVAGRTAYDLVLTPRTSGTLVGSASIAVDSQTGLPLRVDIQARGQDTPAFRLAFTSLSLQRPSAGLFSFVPPPGATVKEQAPAPRQLGAALQGSHHDPGTAKGGHVPGRAAGPEAANGMSVTGTGWDAVVEVAAGAVPADLTTSPLFAAATRAVPGGRLLSTALLTVLVTDDGRVFAGSVPPDRLQAAANAGH